MKLFFIDDTNIAKEEYLKSWVIMKKLDNVIRDAVNNFMEIKKEPTGSQRPKSFVFLK